MDIAAAIAYYDALLARDPALAHESGSMLLTRQPGARLMFGSRPMCSCLRPQFIDAARYAAVSRICATLAAATKRLEAALLSDEALLEVLDLSPDERHLVTIEPGYADAAATTRLDSFVAGESWQFVEYNAESPAGIAYIDTLSDLFRELPVMQAFEARYQVRPLPARFTLLDTLLDAYRRWGGRNTPVIAIVDWQGLPTASEFELFRELFHEQGHDTLIVDPCALEHHHGRLYAGDKPIDLVYRRVLTHELLARKDEAPALLQAYEAGAVCMVNAFRCKLFHKKAIFAILSDEANAHLFSAAEQQAIRLHIPWTRKVRDGYTTYDGRRVSLVDVVQAQRERMVLKPNDEYGGKGVVLGWEVDAATWEQALAHALQSSYVVQERVETARTRYPVFQDGSVQTVEFTTDLDPFLFGTQVTGLLTRVSPSSLLNVTAGTASTIPTFVVEDRDQ
ncbi:MAG TPA: circularly permuted type 2 ATP-grasp protein [Chloroflexota bacterium]|nr:circularly permuted type 2 ATP-grasp protein [Chloroflexota bacterium]